MIPLHVWLPRAHPVAPSHVSALMSGVMIKAGIYGLVRFAIECLGAGPSGGGSWSSPSAPRRPCWASCTRWPSTTSSGCSPSTASRTSGSSCSAWGSRSSAPAAGAQPLVVLGLAAALFHTLNHALFKALLFLGAGAVQAAARHP